VGVNIGRLGFLADIDTGGVERAVEKLEAGAFQVEKRMVLRADTHLVNDTGDETGDEASDEISNKAPILSAQWALNEFVVDRTGETGLLEIDVRVGGVALNTYWADGLIFATPTGSTAYSLSAGGPILAPGVEAVILTPIAPHTLTVRPIVLPGDAVIEVRVRPAGQPYVFAADGRNNVIDNTSEGDDVVLSIEKAPHTVNLAKLDGQHYFKTLRSKLMWGANAVSSS
jgi:NAD+ kinase